MKIVKKLLLVIAILVALPLVAALFIPRSYVVEVSENIQRPKQEIYDYMRMLKTQEEYSVWLKPDPNLKPVITGEDGSVGAMQSWESEVEDVGSGTQTIIGLTEDSVVVALNFIKPFEGKARAATVFQAVSANETKVTRHEIKFV